jgi:hypothetical protein
MVVREPCGRALPLKGRTTPDRLSRLLAALGDISELVAEPRRLCRLAADVLAVDGAGISLISAGQLHGQLCASDELITRLERLQFSLGEGPCGSAFAAAAPVLEPNLVAAEFRWPVFAADALALGVRAVFAFPLGPGLAGIGALTLYRSESRDLTDSQLADALVLADLVTEILLTVQLGAPANELDRRLRGVGESRVQIHQATGMVSAQLGAAPGDALSRLRAHAWSTHRTLAAVSADVVTRRLRFARDVLPDLNG